MKKIIKKVLIFFLIKFHFIIIFEKKLSRFRSLKMNNKSILPFLRYNVFDKFMISLYYNNYYKNLNNPKKQIEISKRYNQSGDGLILAKEYYKDPSLGHRKSSILFYQNVENLINEKNLNNTQTYFMNFGSSSGLDILNFREKYEKINYISCDIDNNSIQFQRQVSLKKFPNIEYTTDSLEVVCKNIKKILDKNSEIKIIFFTNNTLQHNIPSLIVELYENLKQIKNDFYFCATEKLKLNVKESQLSEHINYVQWHHDLKKYAEKYEFKTFFYERMNIKKDIEDYQKIIFSNLG